MAEIGRILDLYDLYKSYRRVARELGNRCRNPGLRGEIDELRYVTFDIIDAELLFQLLATRYETMSTIITSNLSFSNW